MSPTLFNLVYDIFLHELTKLGLVFVAFADDVVLIVPRDQRTHAISAAKHCLSKIGLQINEDKTVTYDPLGNTAPPLHLGHPIQDAWQVIKSKATAAIAQIHSLPLVPVARIRLLNMVVAPKLLYAECLDVGPAPTAKQQLDKLDLLFRQEVSSEGCPKS
eukprot:TRINITY_DN28224_c0_g2_i1.p1 TRINITY_DN28224_c0_g2~~TRINITY_DN28224_c0_g2_i1.p1  ORF type:complete len:160 (+),score=22.29 TRINITY_DN28224_c0_g2_i1:665-1144(+)